MIPTCEKLAKDCVDMKLGHCDKCGAPISWHVGGSLDVYRGRDPEALRKAVHESAFGKEGLNK